MESLPLGFPSLARSEMPRFPGGVAEVNTGSPVTDATAAPSSSDNIQGNNNGAGTDRKFILLRKRFTSTWARRHHAGDDVDDEGDEGVRGPIGLRLLHHSTEPLIDLIFVHGLRGGSVKTWRKGSDPRWFWPQYWLPTEPGMENVNIYTFGYDADWASLKPDILNVYDFGQVLLEEMRNAPSLRGNGEVIITGSPPT